MTILFFNQINATNIDKVGGKGANLGEMTQAGFPVPTGFCIATDGYQRIINTGNLYPQIETLLHSSPNSFAKSAEKIQQLILSVPIPEDLAEEISNAYRKLSKEKVISVAVRSSATAEDLPEASFAGQQETYLGVRDEKELLHHIQLCWASLWTERAISYRQRNNFPHEQVFLSVVVQMMVEPETAGVLFTANPLNGKRDEMLINASYGLGESVVSGQITPDSYRVSLSAKSLIVEEEVGTKETRIDTVASGGTRVTKIPVADRERLCLNPSQLRELANLGKKIENHYEVPQDIEWAFAGDELFLLQTRPITSLNEVSQRSRQLSKIEHRVLDDILEHYPDPPYPLDYFAVTEGYDQVQNVIREAGMKIEKADQIIKMDEQGIPFVEPVTPKFSLKMLLLPLMIYKKMHLDPEDWKMQDRFFSERISSLKEVELDKISKKELARFIADAVQIGTEIGTLRFSKYIAPMMLRGTILIVWVKMINRDKNLIEADLLGTLDYKTAVIDRALDELAKEADKEKLVRSALLEYPSEKVMGELEKTNTGLQFLEKVDVFLEEYGARTMKVYLPFSNYSWAEKPEDLMAVLPLILRSNSKKGKSKGEFSALKEKTLRQTPKFLQKTFLQMLTRYRNGHIAREATLYAIEEAFSLARKGTNTAAQNLFREGILSAQEDILFLTLPELYDGLRGHLSSEMIKEIIAKRQKARPKANAIWQDRGIVEISTSIDMIKGQSGSPGIISGKVKVISGPAEFHKLNEGDVLVCQFTDPTWTPLFGLASAVVADTGGALSHAAIVAREYGIPAVLGTQVATAQLKDKMDVRVDGNQGMVFIEGG
jgi:rifampicin phosphotransferase